MGCSKNVCADLLWRAGAKAHIGQVHNYLLHLACWRGDSKCIKQLLAAGFVDLGNTNTDENGSTPAFIAGRYGHAEALRLLSEAGADLNFISYYGSSIPLEAAKIGSVECLSFLIEKGGINFDIQAQVKEKRSFAQHY